MRSTNVGGALSDTSGEYDAMGRNVVDPGPYVTLNTELPTDQNDSRIDLGGSAEGYRPGRAQYQIDGLAVSEREFMMEINSGRIGGAFGLMESAARMSMGRLIGTNYSYKDPSGRQWFGLDRATAFAFQRETHGEITEQRFWTGTPWSFSFLILPGDACPAGQVCPAAFLAAEKQKLHDKEFEKKMDDRLKQKDGDLTCEQALDKLAAAVFGTNTTFRAVANKYINHNDGFGLWETVKPLENLLVKTDSYALGSKKKLVYVGKVSGMTSPDGKTILLNNNLDFNVFKYSQVMTFFHEVFHTSGKDHKAIVEAIAGLGIDGLSQKEFDKIRKNWKDGPGGEYSDLLNAWLDKHCQSNSGNWRLALGLPLN